MRIINGVHASTVGMAWDNEEMFKIIGEGGAFTLLDPLLLDIENGGWYGPMRQRFGPDLVMHIRMYPEAGWPNVQYHPHWNELTPGAWASECRWRLGKIPGLLDDPNVILSFANEPDLVNEGHPGAAGGVNGDNVPIEVYREIWDWYRDVVGTWRWITPSARCRVTTVPLAVGHEPVNKPPDWEYTMPECKAMVDVCDVLNVHAYFLPDGTGAGEAEDGYWRGIRCLRPKDYRENVQSKPPIGDISDPGGLCAQYPTMPFIVSEFGNFAHDQADTVSVARTMRGYNACYRAYSDSGRCLGVTPFLWNSGDEHKANRIRGNTLLTQALQNMTRYPSLGVPKEEEYMPNDYHVESLIPNNGGRLGAKVDLIVVHSTRGGAVNDQSELSATINWFKNPTSEASAHLVIAANGDYWYCVDPELKAWHANSKELPLIDVNKHSVGIELVQRTALAPFTGIQYRRLAQAVQYYCVRYDIPAKRVYDDAVSGIVGHEHIRTGAADGKSDPGHMFDWYNFMLLLGVETPTPPIPDPDVAKLTDVKATLTALLSRL